MTASLPLPDDQMPETEGESGVESTGEANGSPRPVGAPRAAGKDPATASAPRRAPRAKGSTGRAPRTNAVKSTAAKRTPRATTAASTVGSTTPRTPRPPRAVKPVEVAPAENAAPVTSPGPPPPLPENIVIPAAFVIPPKPPLPAAPPVDGTSPEATIVNEPAVDEAPVVDGEPMLGEAPAVDDPAMDGSPSVDETSTADAPVIDDVSLDEPAVDPDPSALDEDEPSLDVEEPLPETAVHAEPVESPTEAEAEAEIEAVIETEAASATEEDVAFDVEVVDDVAPESEIVLAVIEPELAADTNLDTEIEVDVPALRLRGVTKRFGETLAVDAIDLTVPAGSFYGLVGPNGAGKTTTLSMIAGLLRPDSGEVTVGGIDGVKRAADAKRRMGVLPDRLRTFDRLTGRQLLYYYGVLRGLPSAVVESRTNDLARAFDLVDALGRSVSDYSAGMTKKVMLAGAMIHSPRLLVLDEPFESVDPVSSAVILDILTTYVEHGGTVILSSHGMELVERVCSGVAVLVAGHVLAEGTVDEVRGELTLEERFLELAGGSGDLEGLEWLHTFSD